jgi:hypothetical protein
MKILKVITCNVDIISAVEIYTTDLTALLFKKIKEKFELKCYRGFYISKILQVINHSAIVIKNDTVDATGVVSVQFEVEGIQFIKKELIVDVNFIAFINNMLHFSNKYIKGIMKMGHESNKQFMDIIPEKAQIPVIVNGSTYNPGSDAIVVSAVPFSPREFADSPIFFICESKTSDSMERQSGMIADIELLNAELTIHQKIKDEKNYIFFSEQIYPYKQNLSTTAIANDVEFIPLNDIIKLKKGEFVYSMFDYHNLESFSKIPVRSVQETKTQDVSFTKPAATAKLDVVMVLR